ncbi:GNAT family N-acetyltransferase [Xenorhabdus sp. 12]|uniref:GNAT family N-acetyltransferase n=1 Tax=Xenorhabdus santafensis TaxID=2582833 RepID=A0ABU4S7Q2_9GAMM|nr:GNAT family N-acetyltransferase [Xenorhabdus sp. 12]MDX7986571.1 GNAT family N-acetyltransferase [Xenorhabdus sp. 12]
MQPDDKTTLNDTASNNIVPASTNNAFTEKTYANYQAIIKEVSKHDMLSELERLKANEMADAANQDIKRHSAFQQTANSIKNIYGNQGINGGIDTHRYFICTSENKTVGIIIFISSSSNTSGYNTPDRIGYILTHPGRRGYGRLLIEHAVNISMTLNHTGDLILDAEPYATPIYQKIGFSITNSNNDFDAIEMKLIPSESRLWKRTPDGYQFIKHSPGSLWRCYIL